MRLVLFDIDGTLILTHGAGMRAFYRGMAEVFSLAVESEIVNPDGKTDPLIARECLAHFNREHCWSDESRNKLFASYLACLEEEMEMARASATIRILPGVTAILDLLAAMPEFALGLVTGNLEGGARIKLSKAGLADYFHFGGYGSDSEDRTTLIRMAIQRGRERTAPALVEAAFVIGDTPLDVMHGRAAGAYTIAVASARYGMADLKACDPDLLVPALTEVDSILSFLRQPI
jgi:phosphoglycolate phosphatase